MMEWLKDNSRIEFEYSGSNGEFSFKVGWLWIALIVILVVTA